MIHGSHLAALRYGNRGSGTFSRITAAFKLGICGGMLVLFLLTIINAEAWHRWHIDLRHWLLFGDGWPLFVGVPSIMTLSAWVLLKKLDL